ncbi:MAG TPA: DUF4365 domain-containing protein [Methanocorpusculum sp.]|nr:DUF4365 domain-containing protein [Methanocorpusculum sp.]
MTPAETNHTSRGGLDLSAQKDQFGIAYLHAVASVCGYALEHPAVDYDSIDVRFVRGKHLMDPNVVKSDPSIKVQLKTTSQNIFRGDVISFPVSIKNYNDLRANNCDPAILIVIHLPEDPTEWIMYQDQKILQAEGYYYSLRGLPQLQNSSSVTLTIPKTNTFTPDTLHDMMTKISRGETI